MIRNRYGTALVMLVLVSAFVLGPARGQAGAFFWQKKHTTKSTLSCEQKVALINYRSSLLEIYKSKNDRQYRLNRSQWASRISYASEWVPKDAKKTADKLYKYDELHATTNKELITQITSYKYLEKSPLKCSGANQAKIAKLSSEITGLSGKKAVSGNALINKYKQQEAQYFSKDLKNSANDLMKKLQSAKQEQPHPSYPALDVKTVM